MGRDLKIRIVDENTDSSDWDQLDASRLNIGRHNNHISDDEIHDKRSLMEKILNKIDYLEICPESEESDVTEAILVYSFALARCGDQKVEISYC